MKALVTGGGGFLGGVVVRKLLARGDAVRSFTRTAYPWLAELGVEQAHGDLADADAVAKAVAGCDAVFHVAAKAGVWGRYADFFATNVTGTENVLAACRAHGVARLVYTSTPSVVHGGGEHRRGGRVGPVPEGVRGPLPGDEGHRRAGGPRRERPAAGDGGAAAAPGLGAGRPAPDPAGLSPRPRRQAPPGRHAPGEGGRHLHGQRRRRASARRRPAGARVAGRREGVLRHHGEPVDLWEFLNRVLAVAGLPPVTKSVSVWKARLAGRVLEFVYRVLRLSASRR